METNKNAAFCTSICANIKPDILHLDSWDKHRCWWHSRPGSPRIIAVTNHGEGVGSQFTDWRMHINNQTHGSAPILNTNEWVQERNCLIPADTVIATCRFDRWILSDLLALGKKVKLVYNPLAPYHWSPPLEPKNQHPTFMIVGIWGQDERGLHLARQACKAASAELLVPSNVSRKALVAWYDRSHALLLPGFQSKGYDLSVAEALARRIPVIYGDAGVATMEAIDQPWIVTTPVGDTPSLVQNLSDLPMVPTTAADRFRPERHVTAWLESIGA